MVKSKYAFVVFDSSTYSGASPERYCDEDFVDSSGYVPPDVVFKRILDGDMSLLYRDGDDIIDFDPDKSVEDNIVIEEVSEYDSYMHEDVGSESVSEKIDVSDGNAIVSENAASGDQTSTPVDSEEKKGE